MRNKSLKCDGVYGESALKEIYVKGILASIRPPKRMSSSSNKNANLVEFARRTKFSKH